MAVLLTGIIFLGFPHGALDIFLIDKLSPSRKDLLVLLFFYILAIAAMVASWILIPEGAFLFFIAFSCFHFAQSDLSLEETKSNLLSIEFFARFLTPFFIPFGFHSASSLKLAGFIHDTTFIKLLTPMFFVLAVISIALCAFIFARGIYDWVIRKKEWQALSLEPLIICVLFLAFDPLYSLGIYFCFIHSVKHIVNFLNSPIEVEIKRLIPFWIVPIVAVILFSFFIDQSQIRLEDSIFKWSIMILSSIALPHTFLIYFCKRIKLIR
jgi:Brp/Blh family beta-carotene 15,15'-monooxygenase